MNVFIPHISLLLLSFLPNGVWCQSESARFIHDLERRFRTEMESEDSLSLSLVRQRLESLEENDRKAVYSELIDSITSGALPLDLEMEFAKLMATDYSNTCDLLTRNITYRRPGGNRESGTTQEYPLL